ncbi:uncharacterized protein LOC125855850 [Solanum stenotomum]|uniref:uncharacterized protein LOC125855850 n=1 Tax=Solanum stenotomum TaxID=172797 RepID=UPI0020D178B2|nr:uncharacterized protein LOC125855850 [Solanum stenotomum]
MTFGDVTLQHVQRTKNKKIDALAALASTLILPDQTQVTICQKCIVPLPTEEEYIENVLEHLVAVSEVVKEDWRQPIIDYKCYGILPENPILPLERQIPSLKLSIQEGCTEEENARLRLAELETLNEKRLEAQQNLECKQTRLSRAFNKKVRLRCFQVGDQVLTVRRPIITSHKSAGKFTSKWDRPYVVQESYSHGAYKLVDTDGVRIGPINAKFLKSYYP